MTEKEHIVSLFEKVIPEMEKLDETSKQINDIYQYIDTQLQAWKQSNRKKSFLYFLPALGVCILAECCKSSASRGALALAGVLIFACIALYRGRQSSLEYQKKRNSLYAEVNDSMSHLMQLRDELSAAISNQLGTVLPQKYWYTFAIRNMTYFLRIGRANTLGEAINLFELLEHQDRMEKTSERTANAAEKTAYWAEQAASEAGRAANTAENIFHRMHG